MFHSAEARARDREAGRDASSAAREYQELAESMPFPEEVDWDDAPSQFKLYRGHPRIPLGYENRTATAPADRLGLDRVGLDRVGQLLFDSYGVARYRWTAADALRRLIGTRGADPPGGAKLARNSLRPVPSGGSRFPAELYLVSAPDSGVAPGVHHYDAAHHALVAVREGDWTVELAAGLGLPGTRASLTVLVSAFFWKNAFKYGDLTYRLCGLDCGVLVGQLLEVVARYQLQARVSYQFVDDDVDRLLRLDPMRESVYAAITIGELEESDAAPSDSGTRLTDDVLVSRTGGSSVSEPDWSLDLLPLQARVHRASRLPDRTSLGAAGAKQPVTASGVLSRATLSLPRHRIDLLSGLSARRSSMGYFTPADMSLEALSALLAAAAQGYSNDLDQRQRSMQHTILFCAVNRVSGVDPGVYRYRPASADDEAGLELVRAGDIGDELQESLLIRLFNLTHANLCVYPVGDYGAGFEVYGDRWFRMQNMEGGIMTQRLYLAAAALGLRCHASLGYDVRRTNRLLGVDGTGLTSLIQVMIGSGRAPGDFYEAAWQ
ncbi:SagB family peptide dehydrogenase [Saccharopolyspora sp. ASAGF58]|uniref:SagB family peptide dehydrogenase n=1 Tax=Saccharopolyspora sp. ASAGF58 TaxID=2719023 RepID=UPI00143FBC9F|nr:SagB family peptide dehydrogenase [Saccharopolyspora sp. ASAGF58]QIZ37405.1 SagB/ThcOx family dehydrogenase [Saccharopolyspora sp. ASAGF58]